MYKGLFMLITRASLITDDGVLGLLVTTNFEFLASADGLEILHSANGAFQLQHNLLGCFSLLMGALIIILRHRWSIR